MNNSIMTRQDLIQKYGPPDKMGHWRAGHTIYNTKCTGNPNA